MGLRARPACLSTIGPMIWTWGDFARTGGPLLTVLGFRRHMPDSLNRREKRGPNPSVLNWLHALVDALVQLWWSALVPIEAETRCFAD